MENAGKVGALVVAFVVMLYGGYAVLGKSLFAPKTRTFYAEFKDAGGTVPGTRLLMAGVNIGTVTKVELVSPTLAKMTLAIKPDVLIPQGSSVLLPTSLTGIGEQLLSVMPPKQITGALPDGSTLPGGKQNALDAILPNGEEAVAELTRTMAAFRKLLEDKSLTNEVKSLMATTNRTMTEFGTTAKSVNTLLIRNADSLDKALLSASKTMENVQGLTRELYSFAKSGKMQGDMNAIMANLKEASAKGNQLVTEINNLVADPELQSALKNSAKNVSVMTDSGVRMAASGEKIAANAEIMTADGTIISKRVIELTEKAGKIADQVNEIAEKINKTLGKVSGAVEGGVPNPISNIQTRFDIFRESKPNFVRTDFTAIFPQKNGDSFQLGMFNAFEGNLLTAQMGKKISDDLGIRYGVFASKPGLGVDYSLGSRTLLRGDVFSLNDPRFDLKFRYDFGKGVIGWVGMDRVFKDNAPIIGFGISR